jgi:DNA repair protein RecO (recombination protein O)
MLPVRVKAILLRRVNYLESDKIVKILTSEGNKVDLIARGVRKNKSKLAGSIEPFGVFEACYVPSRKKGLSVLTSARLYKWYKNILLVQDKSYLSFEILRLTEKNIEENGDPEIFSLVQNFFNKIDCQEVNLTRLKNWYYANFLRINGILPKLTVDIDGRALNSSTKYSFNLAKMGFSKSGDLNQNDIKYLRLVFSKTKSDLIFRLSIDQEIDKSIENILDSIFKNYLQI